MPNNTIISIVIGATLLVGGGLAGGGLGGTGTSTIESAPSTLEYRADSISAALASKTQEQKTLIKALEIDKAAIGTRDTVVFGKLQYDIEIVNIEQIEGGGCEPNQMENLLLAVPEDSNQNTPCRST